MVGTGVGAELGILIKGGAGLEIGRKINKLIFDKTGTLTLGTLVVVNHELFSDRLDVSTSTTAVMMGGDAGGGGPGFVDLTSELFFAICAAAESGSEHPLGRSIVQHARKVLQLEGGGEEKNGGGGDGGRVLDVSAELPFELIQFTALPGSGIRAVVGPFEYEKKTPLTLPRNKPVSVMLGNPDFLIEGNITVPAALVKSKRIHEAQGHTVVAVAINNACVGFIALADAIKPEGKRERYYLYIFIIDMLIFQP